MPAYRKTMIGANTENHLESDALVLAPVLKASLSRLNSATSQATPATARKAGAEVSTALCKFGRPAYRLPLLASSNSCMPIPDAMTASMKDWNRNRSNEEMRNFKAALLDGKDGERPNV